MKKRWAIPLVIVACSLIGSNNLTLAAIQTGITTRVSIASDGTQANNNSEEPSISADGRFVAFVSYADNLVSGDTNQVTDIFVRDRSMGQTELVSKSSSGALGNNYSYAPSISADGRFVAFQSIASNLVSGDTYIGADIFIHDRLTGQTELVSISSAGVQGDGDSYEPSISADGRFVAFESYADNLVSDDTVFWNVFIRDRGTGQTELISKSSEGEPGNEPSGEPSISADGRFVAFRSGASNLVSGDANEWGDIFVYDRQTGQVELVSVASNGAQGNNYPDKPSISADGRFVAFSSYASNLVIDDTNLVEDVFVHDRQTRETRRVSISSTGVQGDNWSERPVTSADGRFVAFMSDAHNLVSGDTNLDVDIYVHDLQTGQTECVSVNRDGAQGDGNSFDPSISAAGRFVAFFGNSTNLVYGDTNGAQDVFVYDREGINYYLPLTQNQP